ncbi:MAG TPA: FkbM family methyltransferase [Bacteroidia bacterium]|nr:FkbM family methyltransferase [Bacteroidia bacterium]
MLYLFPQGGTAESEWYPPEKHIPEILELYSSFKQNITFVQIGSNEGIVNDPIYQYVTKYKWRGILIEPVKYLFDKLTANYAGNDGRLLFENVAIGKENGNAILYRLRESSDPGLPYWYDQLGSFRKEIVLKHKNEIPRIEEFLMEETVSVVRLDSLLKKYSISKLDLIHIDTEGYDYEIIKTISLKNADPDLILFEHKHLSDTDYKACVRYLSKQQFVLFSFWGDTIALAPRIVPVLIKS